MKKKSLKIILIVFTFFLTAYGSFFVYYSLAYKEKITVCISSIDNGSSVIFDSTDLNNIKIPKINSGNVIIKIFNKTSKDIMLNFWLDTVDNNVKCAEYDNKTESYTATINKGKNVKINFELANNGYAVQGFTVEKYTYAVTSKCLKNILANENLINDKIVLLNDINSEGDLYIRKPCCLDLKDNSLIVNGNIIFSTNLEGTLIFKNKDAKIKAENLYAEAPKCKILVDKDFVSFNNRYDYYLSVLSYNNIQIDPNCKTVYNNDELIQLSSDSVYPKIKDNMTIVLKGTFDLSNKNVEINHPVILILDGDLKSEYSIIIKTKVKSNIQFIEKNNSILSAESITVSAPFCNLLWDGKDSPDIHDVALFMNVKTYNGKDIAQYGLGGAGDGYINSVKLLKQNNNSKVDCEFTIEGNMIYGSFSYLVGNETLENAFLNISVTGGTFDFDDSVKNKNGSINLLSEKGCYCTITDKNQQKRFYIFTAIINKCELPVVYINTKNNAAVTSKENYISAIINIDSDDSSEYPYLSEKDIKIRGRGNSTWKMDKKSYKIKFDKKTSVLGMDPAKDWVLLANYTDKSLIRNHLAMELGKKLSNLTTKYSQYPVDLFFNGTYVGVYSIGEQVEVAENRIEIDENYLKPDTGYLLEIGGKDGNEKRGKDYFSLPTMKFTCIKSPDTSKMGSAHFDFIYNYCKKVEDAIVNLSGYEEYIDVDALIDWFIIQELSYNLDSSFRRSTFIIKPASEKLIMGPIWDFDCAFGNLYKDNAQYNDFATIGEKDGYVGITWMNYLMKDDSFRKKLRSRWDLVKNDLLQTALNSIKNESQKVSDSAALNFKVWNILDKRVGFEHYNVTNYNTYDLQIKYLKNFIETRWKWLDNNI